MLKCDFNSFIYFCIYFWICIFNALTLWKLWNFHAFVVVCWLFFKINFSKNSFRNTIRLSCSVGGSKLFASWQQILKSPLARKELRQADFIFHWKSKFALLIYAAHSCIFGDTHVCFIMHLHYLRLGWQVVTSKNISPGVLKKITALHKLPSWTRIYPVLKYFWLHF